MRAEIVPSSSSHDDAVHVYIDHDFISDHDFWIFKRSARPI